MSTQTLTPARIAENLKDAGCPESFIEEFLDAYASGAPEAQRRLLERQRRRILDRLHADQKKLECFDYLVRPAPPRRKPPAAPPAARNKRRRSVWSPF